MLWERHAAALTVWSFPTNTTTTPAPRLAYSLAFPPPLSSLWSSHTSAPKGNLSPLLFLAASSLAYCLPPTGPVPPPQPAGPLPVAVSPPRGGVGPWHQWGCVPPPTRRSPTGAYHYHHLPVVGSECPYILCGSLLSLAALPASWHAFQPLPKCSCARFCRCCCVAAPLLLVALAPSLAPGGSPEHPH